jgi:DNA polymerase-4
MGATDNVAEGRNGGRAATSAAPLCRDCLAFVPEDHARRLRRCQACGSPRLLAHPDRDRLTVAHVDCDAFYAAVEKRDNPALAARPVIIGGGRRGVVSTACYVARTYGVKSAMPMFKALAACPEAVVIRPDMEKYAAVGREVRRLMEELTPLVEPLSIDEAFLDLAGTEGVHRASPAVALARFALRVEREIGITVSIGLAPNKFLAKIASDLDKPRGFSVIGSDEAVSFLKDKPVTILPGIGAATATRLAKAGIRLVGDVARTDPKALTLRLGNDADRLLKLANGIDERTVSIERATKTISAETTFDRDIGEREALTAMLLQLSEKVARRCRKAGLAGKTVTLKLKTADFRLKTRSQGGLPATMLASRIFAAACSLLNPEADGTLYRLIGVGMSDFVPDSEADLSDLADPDLGRDRNMAAAIDQLRDRFGIAAIERGLVFESRQKRGRKP